MENQFLKLATSPFMNLDHTSRYSGTKLVERESLSQHIVDTIMLGILVIDHINDIEGEEILSISKYITKATYHDLEEVITGDVPRPLKYFNDETLNSLRKVADNVALKLFQEQLCNTMNHYYTWKYAKEDKEGFILSIIDTLTVVNKVIKEVSLLNNKYMLRVAHEVYHYLGELINKVEDFGSKILPPSSIRYLLTIIQDATRVISEILEENKDLIEKYSINQQSIL